jgi:iron complex outermembrane receptor protein
VVVHGGAVRAGARGGAEGPSSALYGQGSLGGIVSLVSKRPQAQRFLELHTGGGSFGTFEAGLEAGGALDEGENVLGRLNLLYRRRGSFVDFVDPSERWFAAPSVTFRLGAKTTLTLLGQYINDDNETALPLVAEGTVLPNPSGTLPITRNTGEPDFPNVHKMWRVQAGYELTHDFNSVLSLHQVVRASWNDVKTSWIYNDTLQDDLRTLTRYALRATDWYWLLGMDTSLRARFTTGAVAHVVLAGLDYSYMDRTYRAATAELGPIDLFDPVYGSQVGPFTPDYAWVTRFDSVGIYLQEQATLFDRLTLLAGGRVDLTWQTVREGFPAPVTTLVEANDIAFTPRLGVSYEFLPGVSVYANYSRRSFPSRAFCRRTGPRWIPSGGSSGRWASRRAFSVTGWPPASPRTS